MIAPLARRLVLPAALTLFGCGTPPAAPPPTVISRAQEPTKPSPPAEVTIRLTKEMLTPLLAALGPKKAADVAELLDGAAVEHVTANDDGTARGTLVHRQRGEVAVAGSPLRIAVTPLLLKTPRPETAVGGVPASVTTPAGLAEWLSADPRRLSEVTDGTKLRLPTIAGLRMVAPHPAAVRATATDDPPRLSIEAEFWNLSLTFRGGPTAAGRWEVRELLTVQDRSLLAFAAAFQAGGTP